MAEPYVDPKTFQLIWYQLTKKGWSFRKSVGLSNDQRYVPPDGNVKGTEGVDFFIGEKSLVKHCMQQGWFPEYLGLPPGVPLRSTTPSSTPPPETPSRPTPPRSTPPTTAPSETALSATAEDPAQGPDAHLSVATPSIPPAASKSATRTPKPAAKASRPPTKSKRGPAPPKRKAAPKARLSKRRHTDEAITEERQCVPESREVPIPSDAVYVTDSGQFAVPEAIADVVESAEDDIPDEIQRETTRARDPRFVTLDDFDSDDFLTALRRGRLFEPLDSDDLNIGGDDWLLELDSEAEGDEDTILVDKDSSDSSDDEWTASPLNDDDEEDPVEVALRKPELDRLQLEEWETYDEHHSSELQVDAAPLYDGPYGPTKAALAFADSPLAMFYFFLPKELWRRIAEETNTYRIACIDEDAVAARARALKRRQTVPSTLVLTVEEYRAKLRRKHPVLPHELVRYIGLLVARSLETRRESLSRHWIIKVEGALSRDTFGQFLSRDRFQDITRYLHFNDNSRQAESGDRVFKIRPVLQTLQKTFFRGYRLGAKISFDEGMVPMRHRRNPMRQYMSAKPNKWGTKFYMTCCAETAYCSRLDIYCGKANKDEKDVVQRAVVKNLVKVLRDQPAQHLVCTDNYYTSIPLSDKLLSMGHYHVGTMRQDRLGWCKEIDFTQKSRPKRMPRGTFRIAQWRNRPEFVALAWMDSKPVRFLATGCSTQPAQVPRREPDGSITMTPCPRLVVDYHEAMGGVDVHDQLRLQRYSIQRSLRMKKYYKTIFLGLVDIALVNAFIVHKIAMKRGDKRVPTHAEFMRRLHVELLSQTRADFAAGQDGQELMTAPASQLPHILQKTREKNGGKTRQWLCKVCSALAGAGTRSFESGYFCKACSIAKKGRVALCNKARRLELGSDLTCSQVWHQTWKNGTAIPPEYQDKIRFINKRRVDDVDSEEEFW